MILGVGIDVVDVDRFETVLSRTPALSGRLFAATERGLPIASLAARFAAKEAVIKALGGPVGLGWTELVVYRGEGGRPRMELVGAARALADALGVSAVHVSLSHDGGIATAIVVLEG
ncbi:MAG TPA: holo-ACP synthase [Dermatophilaceae bacterium]|nr:holo-ACP synthase [Dermatophilaceae bacterium]